MDTLQRGKKAFKQISVFIILHHAEFAASAQDEARLARKCAQVEIQHLLECLPSFFCNSQTLTSVPGMLLSSFLTLPHLVFSNHDSQYMNISLFPAP